jgi:hypothetical protein
VSFFAFYKHDLTPFEPFNVCCLLWDVSLSSIFFEDVIIIGKRKKVMLPFVPDLKEPKGFISFSPLGEKEKKHLGEF